jgi:hypothetical protein
MTPAFFGRPTAYRTVRPGMLVVRTRSLCVKGPRLARVSKTWLAEAGRPSGNVTPGETLDSSIPFDHPGFRT